MSTVNDSCKIYVIGAGMSGLVVALRLQERGIQTQIIEKLDVVGGLGRSFKWGFFENLDLGPHIYHTPDKQLEKIWLKKYGDLLHEGEFWGQNVKGEKFDQFYNYPLSYECLNQLPDDAKQQILNELNHLDKDKRARAKSYSDYIKELVGSTLMKMFFVQYPQKLWGISIEKMTANWAPKRVAFRKKDEHFYSGQWSAVGKFGSGKILERMAESFVTLGGTLSVGMEVIGVENDGQCITKIITKSQKYIEVHPQDIVVSTIPLNLAARYMGVGNNLKYRGLKLIFVEVKKPCVIQGKVQFLYYDHPDIVFHRVSEQKKFCSIDFPADRTVLTIEIAYTEGDTLDSLGEEKLVRRAIEDLSKVGLIAVSEAVTGKVISLPYVYPMLTIESEVEFVRVRSQLSSFLNLYLAGIGGDFHYADLQILYQKSYDLAERLATGVVKKNSELIKRKSRMYFHQEIALGNHVITQHSPAFIIAEIGLNHNGNLSLAFELIDQAKEAGCSAVKFQSFEASNRVSAKVKENRYAEETLDIEEPIYRMFKRLQLSFDDHKKLFSYAKDKDIEIFSTPFDVESVELLESMGCHFYKIASMDLVNLPLIKRVAETKKPIIISTGMSTLGQIEDALGVIGDVGNRDVILLHCVSSYPADPADMNLNVMKTLATTFHVPVGFSDHSIGITASTVALAMNVKVIERHFTIDRFMEGPDHIFSSTPNEMAELVRLSKLVPIMQGSGEKFILESEVETINKFKKCLYAKKDIKKGDVLTEDAITIKGPAGGIFPKYLNVVLGKTAQKDVDEDHPIDWDVI